jgi:hypothetical protein
LCIVEHPDGEISTHMETFSLAVEGLQKLGLIFASHVLDLGTPHLDDSKRIEAFDCENSFEQEGIVGMQHSL